MSGVDIAVTIDFLRRLISGTILPLRTKIPLFDSAKTIVLTDVKCIPKQHYFSDLWPLKIKRNCIVDISLKILNELKMQYRL
jgi:hypothetical protein